MKDKNVEVLNIYDENGVSLEELIEEVIFNYIKGRIDEGLI